MSAMINAHLHSVLHSAISQYNVENITIELREPTHFAFGDYTTNVSLKLSKHLKRNPLEIAKEIASKIAVDDIIQKVKTVAPGFINITIQPQYLIGLAITVAGDGITLPKPKSKKMMIEFGQPNTHKLPHIGHLFSYTFGESLCRLLESSGYHIVRANYQGDVGLHVAKCLYRLMQHPADVIENIRSKPLRERVQFLQTCYQEGSKLYEETDKANIDALNKDIYLKNEPVFSIWQESRAWNLEMYAELEAELQATYHRHYFESETTEVGKQTVLDNVPAVFTNDNGTIIYKPSNEKLHTRVFINHAGNPTYEGKDIGLIALKTKEYKLDEYWTTTASEQNEYWKVVYSAAEKVFPNTKGKLFNVGFGMIQLKGGKMSSRTGNILDAFTLIDTVKETIKNEFSITDPEKITTIALAAIKYSFLIPDPLSNKTFDIETSVNKTGNSGPYLLYTYVRCKSILRKSDFTVTDLDSQSAHSLAPEDLDVLRTLFRFTDVLEQSAEIMSPHPLAQYLFSLAQRFNILYEKQQFLNAEEPNKTIRLAIASAVANTIQQGLYTLGIETVEEI